MGFMVMSITTVTSREFNQDVSKIKRTAVSGPVFITDRGQPSHVLLTIEDYRKLTSQRTSIVDLLAMPDAVDIAFDPPRLSQKLFKPADLS
jgi:prevent-host-death family protein